MRKRMKTLLLIISLLLTLRTANLYGIDNEEKIDVEIKHNIEVKQNGKKIFRASNVLMKDNKIYMSLEDFEQIIGEDISYKDNMIRVESELDLEKKGDDEIADYLTLDKVKIISINIIEKEITVLSCNEADTPANYMTLKLEDKSEIIYKEINKAIPLNMLSEDMIISIEYEISQIEDRADYKVIKIMVLEDAKDKEEMDVVIKGIEIIELHIDKGYIKAAYSHTDKDSIENQIIIHIDLNTNIRDTNNTPYTLEDLKVGQKIKVVTNGILTASLPPQTLGLDIIILKEDDSDR